MKTKKPTYPALNCSLAIALPPRDLPDTHLIQACSRDYGFDFDEEEIGSGMLVPLPIELSSQAIPEVEVEDIEQFTQCFLS